MNTSILHTCVHPYGGAEEHVRTLLTYLHRAGVPVEAAVPLDSPLAEQLTEIGIPVHRFSINSKFDLHALGTLSALIKQRNIGIVHTHNRQEDLIGCIAARLCGIPAITTIHGRINMDCQGSKVHNAQSAVYHFILRHFFSCLIAVSNATRCDVLHCTRVKPDKVVHVVNGVDIERLKPQTNAEQIRQKLGIHRDTPVAGFAARMRSSSIGNKGIMYLLDAMASIAQNVPGTILLIIGEDENARQILDQRCSELGIRESVQFLGYRKDCIDIINSCDIVIHPSLFEGLPRVVLESMGLGKPVIATAVDGVPEIVVDGHTGYLVQTKSSDAIAQKAVELLRDNDKRARFGNNAQKRIMSVFRAEVSAQQTISVYKSVLGEQ